MISKMLKNATSVEIRDTFAFFTIVKCHDTSKYRGCVYYIVILNLDCQKISLIFHIKDVLIII